MAQVEIRQGSQKVIFQVPPTVPDTLVPWDFLRQEPLQCEGNELVDLGWCIHQVCYRSCCLEHISRNKTAVLKLHFFWNKCNLSQMRLNKQLNLINPKLDKWFWHLTRWCTISYLAVTWDQIARGAQLTLGPQPGPWVEGWSCWTCCWMWGKSGPDLPHWARKLGKSVGGCKSVDNNLTQSHFWIMGKNIYIHIYIYIDKLSKFEDGRACDICFSAS